MTVNVYILTSVTRRCTPWPATQYSFPAWTHTPGLAFTPTDCRKQCAPDRVTHHSIVPRWYPSHWIKTCHLEAQLSRLPDHRQPKLPNTGIDTDILLVPAKKKKANAGLLLHVLWVITYGDVGKFQCFSVFLPADRTASCLLSWPSHGQLFIAREQDQCLATSSYVRLLLFTLSPGFFLPGVDREDGCDSGLTYTHQICKDCWVNSHPGSFVNECLARLHNVSVFL